MITLHWLGMKKAIPWSKLGRNFALISFTTIFAVTLLPTLPRLGVGALAQALPLLSAELLFAAVNAIYEEVVFRASYLSQLAGVIGGRHALAITILYFGLGHLAGSIPSGAAGALLAAFFAFFMGKAMLETGGITWS
jgi:membrane protease YdiL (CAAX protease family)